MRSFLLAAALLISVLVVGALAQDPVNIQDRRQLDPNIRAKPQIDEVSKPKSVQSYELRCRGGLTIDDFQRVSEKTTSSGDVIVTMSMTLLAETERAAGDDSSGLHAGFCGWIDRPMNKNETFDSNTGIARKLLFYEIPAKQARFPNI